MLTRVVLIVISLTSMMVAPMYAFDGPIVAVPAHQEDGINQQLEPLGVGIRMDRPEGAILAIALPDVYILPGSPLYWVIRIWESLTLFVADTPEEKNALLFSYAEKRLAETVKLIEKENVFGAVANLERYKGQLDQASIAIQEVSDQHIREQHYNKLEEQVWYQKALLRIIDTESIHTVLTDVSGVFAPYVNGQAGIELEPII